jgi:hypothetical protein
MADEKVIRPLCGILVGHDRIEAAGSQHVEVRRVLRGLGRGRGFEWSHEAARQEVLVELDQALSRAFQQVRWMLANTGPSPVCTFCTGVLSWHTDRQEWICVSCGASAWPP